MKLLDVFEAAFGEEENEENIPDITPTAKEDDDEVLPNDTVTTKEEADVEFKKASTSTAAATKRTTRSSTKQQPVKKSCKQGAPTKIPGPFTLRDAKAVFPDKANRGAYLHTGIPDEYILQCESDPFLKVAIYKCNYAHAL